MEQARGGHRLIFAASDQVARLECLPSRSPRRAQAYNMQSTTRHFLCDFGGYKYNFAAGLKRFGRTIFVMLRVFMRTSSVDRPRAVNGSA